MIAMFGPSAGGVLGVGAAPPAGAGGNGAGGGGGGAYAPRGGSFGTRQIRIRCRDSRRSTSDRSCSFISSTRRRMRSISKTVPVLDSLSVIGCFRGLGGGGFLRRDLSLFIGH